MLYEIPTQLEEQLEEEQPRTEGEGDSPSPLLQAVDNAEEGIEYLIKFIRNKQAHNEALAAEIKELQARKKQNERQIEKAKTQGILGLLGQIGKDKVKTALGTAYKIAGGKVKYLVDTSSVATWPDEALSNKELITWEPKVSKTELALLDNPEALPGVTKEISKTSIGIRGLK